MFKCKQKQSQTNLQQQRYKLEEAVISLYDMNAQTDFYVFDVKVLWQGNQYTIHTFEGGDANKPTLVLFHGYGGSIVHYSKTFKDLCQQFRVIAIDLPGMGFSSKENIKMEAPDDIITYFTTMIELWRQEMNLMSFCLAGHSFGGYIATLYATQYPQFINQLFLLSPAGSSTFSQEQVVEQNDFKQFNFIKRWAMNLERNQWKEQVTPQKIATKFYSNILVNGFLEKEMKLKGKEFDVWKAYLKAMIKLPEGSEKAIFMLFNFPKAMAKLSIHELFESNKDKMTFPITFYFGSVDWMDFKGASILAETYPQISLRFLQDVGHQIPIDNPKLLVQYIIQDFQKNQELIQQLNFRVDPEQLKQQEKDIQIEQEILKSEGGADYQILKIE